MQRPFLGVKELNQPQLFQMSRNINLDPPVMALIVDALTTGGWQEAHIWRK